MDFITDSLGDQAGNIIDSAAEKAKETIGGLIGGKEEKKEEGIGGMLSDMAGNAIAGHAADKAAGGVMDSITDIGKNFL